MVLFSSSDPMAYWCLCQGRYLYKLMKYRNNIQSLCVIHKLTTSSTWKVRWNVISFWYLNQCISIIETTILYLILTYRTIIVLLCIYISMSGKKWGQLQYFSIYLFSMLFILSCFCFCNQNDFDINKRIHFEFFFNDLEIRK